MKIRCDAEVDGLSFIFLETTVTTTEIADRIPIEYDKDGRVAGLEILDARQRFGDIDPIHSVTLDRVLSLKAQHARGERTPRTAFRQNRDRGEPWLRPSHTTGHAGPHPAVRLGLTKFVLLMEAD